MRKREEINCFRITWFENTFIKVLYCAHLKINHKISIHNEESNPGVRTLLSLKLESVDSSLVSCSLLENSGFEEEEEDGRERKRHELRDESSKSLFASPAPTKIKKIEKFGF